MGINRFRTKCIGKYRKMGIAETSFLIPSSNVFHFLDRINEIKNSKNRYFRIRPFDSLGKQKGIIDRYLILLNVEPIGEIWCTDMAGSKYSGLTKVSIRIGRHKSLFARDCIEDLITTCGGRIIEIEEHMEIQEELRKVLGN